MNTQGGPDPTPTPPLFLPHSPQGQGSPEDPQAQHAQGALEPRQDLSSLWARQDPAPPTVDRGKGGGQESGRTCLPTHQPRTFREGEKIGTLVVVTRAPPHSDDPAVG